jgi:hypothetical protein
MGILLRRNSDSGRHTGIALGLRIRNMLFTVFVYKVIISGQRRQTFVAGFFVHAIILYPLKVMTELLIFD